MAIGTSFVITKKVGVPRILPENGALGSRVRWTNTAAIQSKAIIIGTESLMRLDTGLDARLRTTWV